MVSKVGILKSVQDVTSLVTGSFSNREMASFCLLETLSDRYLIGNDGSVGTVLNVLGTRFLGHESELREFSNRAALDVFAKYFSQKGHALQFFFMRNPPNGRNVLREHIKTSGDAARELGMRMGDLLTDRLDYVSQYVVDERIYLILWTRPSIMSSFERKNDKEAVKKSTPPFWPKAIKAQRFDTISETVLSVHSRFIESSVAGLRDAGLDVAVLKAAEALRIIKDVIYPASDNKNWRPFYPEDSARNSVAKMPWAREPVTTSAEDASHMLWTRLVDQIFDQGAHIDNKPGVVIDNMRFANIDISVGPIEPRSFNSLINTIRNQGNEPPWRVSFLLEGNGMASNAVFISTFLANVTAPFWSTPSKLYAAAIKALNAYKRDENGVVARIRISFATWADADQDRVLVERVGRIKSAIHAWGQADAKTVVGDPLEGVMSSVPAIDIRSTATPGLAPLPEAMYVMPWMRETSPFKSGGLVLRTKDGRVFPYQSGSSLQNSWTEIIYGASGKGKSFFMNTIGLAFCLSPDVIGTGGAKLQKLSIIDSGTSSQGLINVLQTALPPHRRHEAVFYRLKMERSDGINPFDLPLGLRRPLPFQKNFLSRLVSIIASSASYDNRINLEKGIIELAELMIEKAYLMADDSERGSTPKIYNFGENREVDMGMEEFRLDATKLRTWYKVSDAFYKMSAGASSEDEAIKLIRLAKVAQRYAVPELRDLLQTTLEEVEKIYADKTNMLREFERAIQLAQTAYPILNGPTVLDFSSAQVIALDLNAVAPNNNPKQSAIMYLLGLFVTTHEFYMSEEDLVRVSPDYLEYHKKEVGRLSESPKCLEIDELHRTEGVEMVRMQIDQLAREGRKYNIRVRLASQKLSDFDEKILTNTTTIWICGVNFQKEQSAAELLFSLSKESTHAIKNVLTGPASDGSGAPVLGIFNTRDGGQHEHILYNTVGPTESWAFSTLREDATLRDRLAEKIGHIEARKRLAVLYPRGTALSAIKERQETLLNEEDKDKKELGAIMQMVDEIVAGTHHPPD